MTVFNSVTVRLTIWNFVAAGVGGLTTKHLWVGTTSLFDGRTNTVTQMIWLRMVMVIMMMMVMMKLETIVELGLNENSLRHC